MRNLVLLILLTLCAACESPPPPQLHGAVESLQIEDLLLGSGPPAQPGDRVTLHYRGWLFDDRAAEQKGSVFDDSHARGRPLTFVLGARQVIRGWDEGIAGMQVGGRRRLRIPAAMAYGERGAGAAIPPAASLLFEVELLAIKPG